MQDAFIFLCIVTKELNCTVSLAQCLKITEKCLFLQHFVKMNGHLKISFRFYLENIDFFEKIIEFDMQIFFLNAMNETAEYNF